MTIKDEEEGRALLLINNNNNNGAIGDYKDDREEEFYQRYLEELEQERLAFIEKWKKENQQPLSSRTTDRKRFMLTSQRSDSPVYNNNDDDNENCISYISNIIYKFLTIVEVFLSNIPLTIGAVGLGWVTMGVVWFKFMEENIGTDVCITVRYNSNQCTYPEFPGCFQCNTSNTVYIITLYFHYICHVIGGICCIMFVTKLILAWEVVKDELSNPTTATPMGVVCITIICVVAGRFGIIGEIIVLSVSLFHVILAFWFLYTAIYQFRLLPDPGWFPNTVGISYAAIKTWLYFPVLGKVLMSLAMLFFFSLYFISIYRVIMNRKIAAPVCFIQLSAPSITMYAMTIMAQPSRSREIQLEASPELMHHYQIIHRDLYMPVMHFMMFLSLVGMISVLQSLWARWPKFRCKEFSPAHIAFVFPLLSHTNAVQAYRAGVDSFSTIPNGSPFKIALFSYWFICLIVGTVVNLIFTWKYVRRLPKWTKIDVGDEDEAVSPSETLVHEMLVESNVHETMSNQLVNPALLQANEAGSLVRLRRGSRDFRNYGPFVRTRKVTALGFDFIMSEMELRQERAELLDWVAKNAPRTRRRTLSIPGMMKLFVGGKTNNSNVFDQYGTFDGRISEEISHKRSSTMA